MGREQVDPSRPGIAKSNLGDASRRDLRDIGSSDSSGAGATLDNDKRPAAASAQVTLTLFTNSGMRQHKGTGIAKASMLN